MSEIQFLRDRLSSKRSSIALFYRGQEFTYGNLLELVDAQIQYLKRNGVKQGDPIVLKGDYSPGAISCLLALIELGCIIIPLTPASFISLTPALAVVSPKYILDCSGPDPVIEKISSDEIIIPDLYKTIQTRLVSGLVLFTSGSSGTPKAVVHDFSKLINKFRLQRPILKTLNFLLFDHWGGLNTLLHCLSNLSPIIVPDKRTPEYIAGLIDQYEIELLPATPGFLNMLILSRVHERFNFGSLKLITYGAEPMSDMTLSAVYRAFPGVDIRQTYGMIELGVLRAKTRAPDSPWVKLGGEGYEIRIVDSKLEIKAESAMLGYLNAETPFTPDGFLKTGDLVEQDGDWIRILGRQSDLINVGGQKVYPAEVESALMEVSGVCDAMVYGEPNPILGKIVCATIVKDITVDDDALRIKIKKHCQEKLLPYMIPVKLKFAQEIPMSHRLKRIRHS